uniref:MOG interacting and ectopic P-granules protein 1 n=2 Tax=Clastoptera arizonana TaxID=38151 RepID=A0A1B6D548_9HEMI
MESLIEENGTPADGIKACDDLNSSAVKMNGEINGAHSEPMEVDESEELISVKKVSSDVKIVSENDNVQQNNTESEKVDNVSVVSLKEVPVVAENMSRNGFTNEDKEISNQNDISDEKMELDDEDRTKENSSILISSESEKLSEEISDLTKSNEETSLLNNSENKSIKENKIDSPSAISPNKNDSDRLNTVNNKKDIPEKEDCIIVADNEETEVGQSNEQLGDDKSKPEEDLLDNTLDKGKKSKKVQQPINITPRRSSRNINKQKSYVEKEDELKDLDIVRSNKKSNNDDDDVEEITPVDPLASDVTPDYFKDNKHIKMTKKTIVVNDTKRLVEIASGKPSKMNKKEPTLVIIDTNSILSGRGPIPISNSTSVASSSRNHGGYSALPIALPAQGMYSQIRSQNQVKTIHTPQALSTPPIQIQSQPKTPPIILPSLTDDMYVVEAPSFIVPYVYEKPPLKPLKDYVDQIEKAIKEIKETLEKEKQTRKEDKAKEEIKKEDVECDTLVAESVENEDDSKKEGEPKNDSEKVDEIKSKEDADLKMDVDEDKDNEKDKDDVSDKDVDKDKTTVTSKSDSETASKVASTEEAKQSSDESKQCTDKVIEPDKERKISENSESKSLNDVKVESEKCATSVEEKGDTDKNKKSSHSYFDNPLGKFFIQIGVNLVQEHVQTDLLRSQKRKKDKDGVNCAPEVQMAITSLIRTLEFSKENNEPFRLEQKKCEFCSFKTESMLAMAHHLETPHMRNYVYRCNFCPLEVRSPHDILFHMEAEHNVRGRLERAPAFHQCPSCPFEDNQKGKLTRHLLSCAKKYRPERNQEPPLDFEPPAKIPRISRNRPSMSPGNAVYQAAMSGLKQGTPSHPLMPKLVQTASPAIGQNILNRGRGRPQMMNRYLGGDLRSSTPMSVQQKAMAAQMRPGLLYRPSGSNSQPQVLLPTTYPISGNQMYQSSNQKSSNSAGGAGAAAKLLQQPSISITPLPRQQATPTTPSPTTPSQGRPGRPLGSGKATFVICEICDGYIKDLEQLRNHMQWIHKVKIHPKMIYNRPPLNCQKCQFRFFTDQGLERHLLGSHGLVTSSMQEAANKGKDGGRCPVCGRVYQWKLLNHVARDHSMSLKPAHLSYKCTVCTATFGMYKQFENHVYSAHSVVAKRVVDKKPAATTSQPSTSSSSHQGDSLLKPLKINDEITIIPQPVRSNKSVSNKPGPSRTVSSKGKVISTKHP